MYEEEDVPSASRMDAPIQLSGRLKRFIGMNHLKRTALNVIANQLTEADIGKPVRILPYVFFL